MARGARAGGTGYGAVDRQLPLTRLGVIPDAHLAGFAGHINQLCPMRRRGADTGKTMTCVNTGIRGHDPEVMSGWGTMAIPRPGDWFRGDAPDISYLLVLSDS